MAQTSETMLQHISFWKSPMVEGLGHAPQEHEMYFHDLEVMGLNPGRVVFGVCPSHTLTKNVMLWGN